MQLDLSQIAIMVVDDNKFIRRIVCEILKGFNVGKVVEAEDGSDALRQLEEAQPDIIICDWVMRPMSGMEFLRTIRSGNAALDPQTPVLMMTGQLDAKHVLEGREVGVSGYLSKPVSVQGMMTRLVDIIRASATAA